MTTDETTAAESGSPGEAEEALTRELKRLIEGSGRSLRTLGNDLKVSPSTLSRAASGKAFPSLTVVTALARTAGGDPDHVRRLWAAADEERRTAQTAPVEEDERELLRMTATALNAERQRRGLPLDKLAKTSGWSKSTLSTVLRGQRVPDMSLLQDVLQAMEMTDAEVGNWTTRFARAAEKARLGALARPEVYVETALVPLRAQLRRWQLAVAAVGVLALAGLLVGGLGLWSATNLPESLSEPGPTTTVTVGTPVPPGPKTAEVDVGLAARLMSVFEQPRADAKVTSTVETKTWVEVTCRLDTGEEFTDDGLIGDNRPQTTKTWLKIAVHGQDLGYVPSIYLKLYDYERPVRQPPACS
ncbi:helix-turn-helix transcriptional regulator [Amycolatopsis australiensis]|uniref:Transcriptional regulator, contains XRE-family HTH domain n=1 Tax=Amycolatopsis australiensis TaxID=546364 RepID=A0A1K1QWQ4_9PSEU|nr:helix-turn-helix transcriptional regulator [Amycolatopsis australiensis]SFW64370.1 Transcriptional regulator, contains XRE-family HTH domain [Amycolatopsis australiensis]